MKKNFAAILFFLLFTLSAFSQNKANNKDYYLRKSKHQKTFFYAFAGTGTGLIITGIILKTAHSGPYTEYYTGGFLVVGGLAAVAISVPFFTASKKNKHRAAASLSFKNEKTQQLNKNNFVYKPVPSLTLKIRL
jgi:hypothetical protein